MRFPQLFGHMDIRNKINLDWVHMICCGLHRYDTHLHAGKNRSFLHAQITSVRGRDRKRHSLNFPRQIPITITYLHNIQSEFFQIVEVYLVKVYTWLTIILLLCVTRLNWPSGLSAEPIFVLVYLLITHSRTTKK